MVCCHPRATLASAVCLALVMREGRPREFFWETGADSVSSPIASIPLSFDLGQREYQGDAGGDGAGRVVIEEVLREGILGDKAGDGIGMEQIREEGGRGSGKM